MKELKDSRLNKDQVAVVKYITDWWESPEMFVVIDAAAGMGKTYLINYLLPLLPKAEPLLLCPTHEALKQLKDKTTGDYTFKTVCSALGITPVMSSKEISFEHRAIPSLWEDYNICLIDEVSMLSEQEIDLLVSTGVKIIWVGHSKQLPPVDNRRRSSDKCISPVFGKGWTTLSLNIPQRNTGELWEFIKKTEGLIDKPFMTPLPKTYNVTKKALTEFMGSEETRKNFLNGDTKVALWSNRAVDAYNHRIRCVIFGKEAEEYLYLPKDKLILTKPLVIIDDLPRYTDTQLKGLMAKRDDLDYLFSNTKATVVVAAVIQVKLSSDLVFPCHKLTVEVEGGLHNIYSIARPEDKQKVQDHYAHLAWAAKSKPAKAKAYKQRHFILSCFAEIKHFYAGTSHRLQGSSIPNVVVIKSDILRNPCKVEALKCLYVAVSRSSKNLLIYNGG